MVVNVLTVLGLAFLVGAVALRNRRRLLIALGLAALVTAVALSPTSADAFWKGFSAVKQ